MYTAEQMAEVSRLARSGNAVSPGSNKMFIEKIKKEIEKAAFKGGRYVYIHHNHEVDPDEINHVFSENGYYISAGSNGFEIRW